MKTIVAVLALSLLDDIDRLRCEQLTGCAAGDALLLRLVRLGLPIVPLTADRRTFRFHAVFRELVQLELRLHDAPLVVELHRRAAIAERASGDDPAAVRHLLAAGDHLEAFDIVFEPVWAMYRSGETRSSQVARPVSARDRRRGSEKDDHLRHGARLVGRLDDAARWNAQAAQLITDDEDLSADLTINEMLVDLGRGDTAAIRSAVTYLGASPAQPVTTAGRLGSRRSWPLRNWSTATSTRRNDGLPHSLPEQPRRSGFSPWASQPAGRGSRWSEASSTKHQSTCQSKSRTGRFRGPRGHQRDHRTVRREVSGRGRRLELDDADTWADRATELAAILGAPIYTFLARGARSMRSRPGPAPPPRCRLRSRWRPGT